MNALKHRALVVAFAALSFSTTLYATQPDTTVNPADGSCPQLTSMNAAAQQNDTNAVMAAMQNANKQAQAAANSNAFSLQTCLQNLMRFNANGVLNGLNFDSLLAALEAAACGAVTSAANTQLSQLQTSYVVPGTAGIVGGQVALFQSGGVSSNQPIQVNTQSSSQRAGQCVWSALNKAPC